MDLLRGIGRKHGEHDEVEMLDLETLRSRIGEAAPKRPAAPPQPDYVRSDCPEPSERSWRKIAGLSR